MSKIEELEIDVIFTTETNADEDYEVFELKTLTKLEISGPTNLSFLWVTIVPSSLNILKFEGLWNCEIWPAKLLGKQKHLKEFNLHSYKIQDFKFDPENCHIEKLDFFVEFSDDSAFEQFSEFIKIQESVTEFKLNILEEELWERDGSYAEILTHLVTLKSLKKLTLDCNYEENIMEVFSQMEICNPAVESNLDYRGSTI